MKVFSVILPLLVLAFSATAAPPEVTIVTGHKQAALEKYAADELASLLKGIAGVVVLEAVKLEQAALKSRLCFRVLCGGGEVDGAERLRGHQHGQGDQTREGESTHEVRIGGKRKEGCSRRHTPSLCTVIPAQAGIHGVLFQATLA